MHVPSQSEENGWRLDLLALQRRVGELERQVAELRGTSPESAPSASEASWSKPVAGQSPPVALPEFAVPPPPPFLTEEAAQAKPRPSLEDRLGSQVFSLVGVLAVIVGASWALKLAFERGLIGPIGRVLIGLTAGVALVLWSEMFRRKAVQAFSYALKAVGTGLLYLTLWAAFHLYHLIPAAVALTAMLLVTAWNVFMAWSQDAELLAGYALLGGFATPMLLSTAGNHEGFLFSYLAALDLGCALLVRWKPWRRLLLPAYAGTVFYFIGWYARFFHARVRAPWDGQSAETAAFALLFFAIFGVVSLRGWAATEEAHSGPGDLVVPVLVPLANAAFVSLASYSVLQDSGLHGMLAWLMIGLAAVYLLLMRMQAAAVSAAVHLAMAVVFLTIAVPLKLSGETLTTAWLVEGLLLYWVSTRVDAGERAARRVLLLLSAAGFALGLLALAVHWTFTQSGRSFFNADLGSALVAVATLAGAAWLARSSPERRKHVAACLAGMAAVALLLILHELAPAGGFTARRTAFLNAEFETALIGLAVLAAVSWTCFRLSRRDMLSDLLLLSAQGTFMLANVFAIASVVREIGSLWPAEGADVQRSLVISGFLMLYGAGLLVAGFRARSAFTRWQGLGLLVLTILKVFLYDVSGLSAGYRVASFLGLGVLLLAVSFAYQKNWLGLRASGPRESTEGRP